MKLSFLRNYLQFILHLIAIILLFIMSLKGVDTSSAITVALISYMGGRTLAQGSAHWAASRDGSCKTEEVIREINEK